MRLITLVVVLVFSMSSQALPVAKKNNKEHFLPNEQNTINTFKHSGPYVVNVHSMQLPLNSNALNGQRQVGGMASGFIWNKKGYVITNYHVIHNIRNVAVSFTKDQTYPAKIIGSDPREDIAVLKVSDKKALRYIRALPRIYLADSDKLEVGQKTIAIGNPFGLSRTLTVGVISALDRQVPGMAGVSIREMIQTDASINPGNSGGPLFDSAGNVIGMTTSIFTKSGASNGIGFAVPANEIRRIAGQIIEHGYVKHAGIGVQLLSQQLTQRARVKGAVIMSVIPGGPAARAGLLGASIKNNGRMILGDVITAINDKTITGYDDIYNVLAKLKVGQKISVTVERNGKKRTVKLKTIDINKE